MPSAAALRASQDAGANSANPLSGASESLLLGTASDVVADVVAKTNLFDADRDNLFPRFDDGGEDASHQMRLRTSTCEAHYLRRITYLSNFLLTYPSPPFIELVLGRVLGRGGFCVVHEVKTVKLNLSGAGATHESNSGEKEPAYTRAFIQARCIRDGVPRYALKQLSEESRSDKTKLLKGTIDLAVEAKFLAVLDHPHIIKMRGASSSGPFEPNYYLVLDKLYDTLEERLRKWGKTEGKTKGVLGKMTGGKKRKDKLVLEKTHVAYDLSTAFKFMHENR